MKKLQLTQQQKYVGFKKAFETYQNYVVSKNFIGAYIVAFSYLEDRVSVAYVLLKDIQKESRPKQNEFVYLNKKLSFLLHHNQLTSTEFKAFKEIVDSRNEKLHEAMWNLETFTENACNSVMKLGRKANKLVRKIKKLTHANV